jgi:hypothetical protein
MEKSIFFMVLPPSPPPLRTHHPHPSFPLPPCHPNVTSLSRYNASYAVQTGKAGASQTTATTTKTTAKKGNAKKTRATKALAQKTADETAEDGQVPSDGEGVFSVNEDDEDDVWDPLA